MSTLDERAQAAAAGLRASSERLRPADGLDRLLGRRRRTVRLAVVGAFALLAALLVVVVQLRPHEEVVQPARPVGQQAIVARYGFGDHLGASPGGGVPVRVLADGGGVWVVVARPAEPSTLVPLGPVGQPQAVIPLVAAPEPRGAELAFGSLWTIDLLGELRRFDPATGRPTLEAQVLEHPRFGGSLTAAGDSLWVVDGGGVVRRIDPATGRVGASVSEPGVTFGPNLAAGEGALWTTSDFGGEATRIDLRDGGLTRLATKAGGGVAAGEGAVWIGGRDRTLVRLDPASGKVEATVDVGGDNRAVAVGENGVWVAGADQAGPYLTRVDPRTNQITGELALDEEPRAVTVANGSVWVTTDAAVLRVDPKAF